MKKSRFTEAQTIAVLREQEVGGSTEGVCRRHGICQQTFYRWKSKYGGTVPRATVDWDTWRADDIRWRGATWMRHGQRISGRAARSDPKSLAERRPAAAAGGLDIVR